jgi:alcohol dehydrogenase (cytochrome c)
VSDLFEDVRPARIADMMRSTAIFLLACAAPSALAVPSPDAGESAYRQNCASCHGADLRGKSAPPLTGQGFVERWTGKDSALFEEISERMPQMAPGSLSRAQYDLIYAYIRAAAAGSREEPQQHVVPTVLPAPATLFATASTEGPDDAELSLAAGANWLAYNRDYRGQRFSPLRSITPKNVAHLVPHCVLQLGELGSFEASPIVRNGRLYVTTPHSTYAMDAASCRELWKHQYTPGGPEPLPTNRGVALYEGMVIRGTTDGHLLALDAENGKLLWDVFESDSRRGYFLAGAPVAFGGKVYIGEAGGDYGAPGHARAFDAKTGRLVWTFNMVPSGKEPGAETWPAGAMLGGSSSWSTITVDPPSREIFVPSGNPGPDVDGSIRAGDNLYSDSVVVLDADSGQLKWYAQQIAHDVHDWDTAAAPVVYSHKGRNYMAVGSKDARLYLYDRDKHTLIARKDLARRLNDTVVPVRGVPLYVCPGFTGGVEWNGPAYDPTSGLLFVNSVDRCATMKVADPRADDDTIGGALTFDPPEKSHGSLRAFDAATGAAVWADDSLPPMIAGVTPTASGLVFTGTADGEFLAVEAKTGKKLYSFYTGGPVAGGVSVYEVNGKEYVAVATGNDSKTVWGTTGAATVIVFSLP